MYKSVKIFPSPYELAEKFAEKLVGLINSSAEKEKPFIIALSGGSTPEIVFSVIADHFSKSAHWDWVHLFWGDERCVSPDEKESNYGMTKRILLDKIDIPFSNIHRIHGEEDPEKEAIRYSNEISEFIPKRDSLPVFDLIILGLGEDGHTASIFPGQLELFNSDKICEATEHPLTLQKRITITGKVINNAASVIFLVTGQKKADIVEKIINKNESSPIYPASHVVPEKGEVYWFIDASAGNLL